MAEVIADPPAMETTPFGEALSGVFGSVSLTAWICLLLPQLITNYKTKSADALSMKFLFIWLAGDIANLSGALFTSLAPSTIALACYFCVADLILITQCTYYNTINARRRARHDQHQHHIHHHHHSRRHSSSSATAVAEDDNDDNDPGHPTASSTTEPATETDPLLLSQPRRPRADSGGLPGSHRRSRRHSGRSRRGSAGSAVLADPLTRIITGEAEGEEEEGRSLWIANTLSLLAVWLVGVAGWVVSYQMGAWGGVGGDAGSGGGGSDGVDGGEEGVQEPMRAIGLMLGYASAVCYLCARIPQIIKNYREKSCEGLALLFFLLSLTGNSTYGASVLAYSQEPDYLLRALPWLLGSLGTMVEDCIIFVQFRIYSPKRQPKAAAAP
ncbi:hypothetical protein VTJ83DRAFT_1811 [Remersonia thermophila]|uniref:Vacuolar membrane PQ loop repeat protein n=1 Tax=Remersonia thermophila TaxID=72144 RepID=A0ABR4DJA6_9PEZI